MPCVSVEVMVIAWLCSSIANIVCVLVVSDKFDELKGLSVTDDGFVREFSNADALADNVVVDTMRMETQVVRTLRKKKGANQNRKTKAGTRTRNTKHPASGEVICETEGDVVTYCNLIIAACNPRMSMFVPY